MPRHYNDTAGNSDDCSTAREIGRKAGEIGATAAGAGAGAFRDGVRGAVSGGVAGEIIKGPAGELGAAVGDAACRAVNAARDAVDKIGKEIERKITPDQL